MPPQRDPISVRTTRLNNLLLGKGNGSNNGVVKRTPGRRSTLLSVAGQSSTTTSVSAAVVEALNRESLLDAFCLLFTECDKDLLKKRDRNIAEFVNKYRSIIDETNQLRVNAEDFNVKTLIGKGYFGNVHLVIERQTNDVYAMKKIKKSVVTTSQVKEERDIMSRRCSEWITNLQYAFQDNENLYLIMEFLPGGDLLSLMTRHGPFDEDLTRFYMAELTLAIHSLHMMGYVHRDIKPENILIDRFGHIKLADFGNAAALDRDGNVLSLSPVGTPDYIAPELLQTICTYKLTKSLHDVSCDFWSMGIIGYELICEITPFHEDNVHETYSKILSHCENSHLKELITFPSDLKLSKNFKNLIESLITNPTNRLGYAQIRAHSYFESVKWDMLRSQVPPIIPTVNSEDDTSNFEDVTRNKRRSNTYGKKSLTTNVKTNDFSGKDLPFIGYSFVHMERQNIGVTDTVNEDARTAKLNAKLKDMQAKYKERVDEINKLKQDALRAKQMTQQSETQKKIYDDAKEEMNKMKNIIKEKTSELAKCNTQIKTLQSSLKVSEEMWEKKETTITELLRLNRQKYEDAKTATEQRYEKLMAEKKNELSSIVQKLDARENELSAKIDECKHLHEKIKNYNEKLHQFKEKSQQDRVDFEKHKMQLSETYEQKLGEMRAKLRNEKDSHSRLTMELRDVRAELNDSIISTKSTQEAKNVSDRRHEEIFNRLNREIEENKRLLAENTEFNKKLTEKQKELNDLQQENHRLEREMQLLECGRTLAESTITGTQLSSPYETAPGSLTELHVIEEQLRADLEAAKENENVQKSRADKLQQIVEKLEEMLEKFNEQSLSPTKPCPAPRQLPSSVGDMLEKQNEKLEDKLAAVREQMILERQSARTANLSLWKTEKKLEEALSEKKMIQRRMELTEERVKKVQLERDEAQRLCKAAQDETKQRDERIKELKDEIAILKTEVHREHKMWEKSEQERMKSKSEIIDHISNVKKLDERLSEMRQKLYQSQSKCDTLSLENKRILREFNEERDKCNAAGDSVINLQIQLKNLQDNYESLKYACTITDNQLTEVETMLETEQKLNKTQQQKIDKLYANCREKDETITKLKKELHEAQSATKAADVQSNCLNTELAEQKLNLQELQQKLISQQQQLIEQTNSLFEAQERLEVLTNETSNLQARNENFEREVNILKEENARILTNLYHSKDEAQRLQLELKEAEANASELHADIDDLQAVLAEKENFYLQRDIKSEATLSQHKKLIDYLQLKVEDLSQKKKKTFADMIFGAGANSAKKENIGPGAIESSIVYRALQEELRREKQRCKTLQEQIDKLNGNANSKSPLKTQSLNVNNAVANNNETDNKRTNKSHTLPKSPRKHNMSTISTADDATTKKVNSNSAKTVAQKKEQQQQHRFELALQETNSGAANCNVCLKLIIAGSPYWKCKACKMVVHRKCRSDVTISCNDNNDAELKKLGVEFLPPPSAPTISEIESDVDDANSLGKYSYEAKLDSVDGVCDTQSNNSIDSACALILDVKSNNINDALEINCAFEIEVDKILLLGCNTGLYAYHITTQTLVHIAGIDSVIYIAISVPLAKVIMVGSCGDSLYQCDYRQLVSRCQSSSSVIKPALEASVLDLVFANWGPNEKWQIVKISDEAENAIDSVAIAATSTRIVILKYDLHLQKFIAVRALHIAAPVSSITFTRHSAIVSSDKFFEIELNKYAAEEFLDVSDATLSHVMNYQPVVAIRISRQEFLLCFMEGGVFVDDFGCRSRPCDLNWEYTPTGFMYREPFLYVSHFQTVQIVRINRSYTKEMASADAELESEELPTLKRAYLPFYMPTLLADSGKINIYTLAIQKETGLQKIHHVNAKKAFKEKLNESLETISSIATSLTLDSQSLMSENSNN